MTTNSSPGKRKRAAGPSGSEVPSGSKEEKLQLAATCRSAARAKRKITRATAQLNQPLLRRRVLASPHHHCRSHRCRPCACSAHRGQETAVLLSLFCGPRAVTNESIFRLEQIGSLAEVRSCLGHFFTEETKRFDVPADLNFMMVNCWGPDRDGPVRGAWPIATAEAYQDWAEGLKARSWSQGKSARVQVVALTNHQLQSDRDAYKDFFALNTSPVPFWFSPMVEEMDGIKWIFDGQVRPDDED